MATALRPARELVHEAVRAADKRGCCNMPACAFYDVADTMLCNELTAMIEARDADAALAYTRMLTACREAHEKVEAERDALRAATPPVDPGVLGLVEALERIASTYIEHAGATDARCGVCDETADGEEGGDCDDECAGRIARRALETWRASRPSPPVTK
jgi:hypothetical protein